MSPHTSTISDSMLLFRLMFAKIYELYCFSHMNKYNISIIHEEKDVEEYGAFSTAIWDCSDEKEIAGDHPDADGLGSGVCLFLSGIH